MNPRDFATFTKPFTVESFTSFMEDVAKDFNITLPSKDQLDQVDERVWKTMLDQVDGIITFTIDKIFRGQLIAGQDDTDAFCDALIVALHKEAASLRKANDKLDFVTDQFITGFAKRFDRR